MSGTLTVNEEAQLRQTIEMFEVITQSQEDDYQSLEILKEAYSKLGMHPKAVDASKRIAQAYVQQGQLSSAILEYESILQRFPDDPDVRRALTAIEHKANSFAAPRIDADLVDKRAATAARPLCLVTGTRRASATLNPLCCRGTAPLTATSPAAANASGVGF